MLPCGGCFVLLSFCFVPFCTFVVPFQPESLDEVQKSAYESETKIEENDR